MPEYGLGIDVNQRNSNSRRSVLGKTPRDTYETWLERNQSSTLRRNYNLFICYAIGSLALILLVILFVNIALTFSYVEDFWSDDVAQREITFFATGVFIALFFLSISIYIIRKLENIYT